MSDAAQPAYLDKRKNSRLVTIDRATRVSLAKRFGRNGFVKSLKTSNYAEGVQSNRLSSHVSRRRPLPDHLLRHSIMVGKWVTDPHSSVVAERIREEVVPGAFKLMVMGGCSRPDRYEFIVGGTTHSSLLMSSSQC